MLDSVLTFNNPRQWGAIATAAMVAIALAVMAVGNNDGNSGGGGSSGGGGGGGSCGDEDIGGYSDGRGHRQQSTLIGSRRNGSRDGYGNSDNNDDGKDNDCGDDNVGGRGVPAQ
jgi:hypothetical protein